MYNDFAVIFSSFQISFPISHYASIVKAATLNLRGGRFHLCIYLMYDIYIYLYVVYNEMSK